MWLYYECGVSEYENILSLISRQQAQTFIAISKHKAI